MIYFEWDEAKAARNLRVHGIDFNDAIVIFNDPFAFTEEDSIVDGELRLRTIGLSTKTASFAGGAPGRILQPRRICAYHFS